MRPAVDPLFKSAAAARRRRVVGVLLSGGGADGVEGLIAIKAGGGMSLVQQPEQARLPSMPVTALREDDVDAALRVEEIAMLVPLLAAGQTIDMRPADSVGGARDRKLNCRLGPRLLGVRATGVVSAPAQRSRIAL